MRGEAGNKGYEVDMLEELLEKRKTEWWRKRK